jgi:hypothetical protein
MPPSARISTGGVSRRFYGSRQHPEQQRHAMKWVEIRHDGDGNRGAAYVADVPGGVLIRTVTHLILHTGLYVSEALAFVPNVTVGDFERKPKDED